MSQAIEKKKILFVDDEPNVLQGLRDSLSRYRKKWDMNFEQYPQKALELVGKTRFDVVVSDMRMPEIDGANLLTQVREIQPACVRIILSGFTELEVAIRAVSVAHQFVTKPCESGHLESIIERACSLQGLLRSSDLRAVVGKMNDLPPIPHSFNEVSKAMMDPNTSAATVAAIIEKDPSMCAKLLQMSNAGFFRLAKPITRVEDAIVYLGFSMIKNLVLSTEVFSKSTGKGGLRRAALSKLQNHSRVTAALALNIAPNRFVRDEAFLAAILHDIGKIVLATEHDDYPANIEAFMKAEDVSYSEAETSLLGVSHAQVGAYLLGLWGLPFNVVEAVAYHDTPELREAKLEELDSLATVALANAIAHESTKKTSNSNASQSSVAESIAASLNVSQKLPQWREHAIKAAEVAGAT